MLNIFALTLINAKPTQTIVITAPHAQRMLAASAVLAKLATMEEVTFALMLTNVTCC